MTPDQEYDRSQNAKGFREAKQQILSGLRTVKAAIINAEALYQARVAGIAAGTYAESDLADFASHRDMVAQFGPVLDQYLAANGG